MFASSQSASEIEALCAKAARGAGMEWGVAEEAGRAAQWLYTIGLNGPAALLRLLDRHSKTGQLAVAGKDLLAADGGDLSPIDVGTALSDFANIDQGSKQISQVLAPLLLLPFVHQIARAENRAYELEWRQGKMFVHPNGTCSGMVRQLENTHACRIAMNPTEGISSPALQSAQRPLLAADMIARLNMYAMRTTVPATAASRANAGSGATDND
ncbi:MAG: DUF3726 domain-containing protein [Pseudomonadota bacterium]